MVACSVKRVAGTCIKLCVYICHLLLFVKKSYLQCRNSNTRVSQMKTVKIFLNLIY
jgi:hypothetical protein